MLNYNFNPIFYFFKNNNYLIRLKVFLTFLEVITNFLNPLNIQRLKLQLQITILVYFMGWEEALLNEKKNCIKLYYVIHIRNQIKGIYV